MSQVSGGQFLAAVNLEDSNSGRLFEKLINGVNSLGRTLGADAVGTTQPPPPISGITLQASNPVNNIRTATSEILHWTINHPGSLNKGTRYFSEIDTNPNFLNSHVVDHGASRSGFVTLPTFSSVGVKANYYLRSYAQAPGSLPTKPYVLGGLVGATAIQMGGTSVMALLSSTGSGTAPTNGSRGGSGLGKVLSSVPAVTTKRSVK